MEAYGQVVTLRILMSWGERSTWRSGRIIPGQRAPGVNEIETRVGYEAFMDAFEDEKPPDLLQLQMTQHTTPPTA
jgi:hypothetical protein